MNDKKILCLGNNTEDTDIRAKLVAREQNLEYHGLITEVKEINPGCYQTSFYDMSYGDLIELSKNMDDIIILDQPKDSYLDEHAFYQTISLGKHLKSTCNVIFSDDSFNYTVEDELKTNKSICILPFIQSVTVNGNYTVCCRSYTPISKVEPTINYSSDANRNLIKQKMIAGEKLDNYCKICYDMEDKEIVSPRITQTIEWSNRLNIKNVNELTKIIDPVYYEIRASNQCNLMCRMCFPGNSSLLDKENQKLKIFNKSKYQYTGFDHVNIDNIEKLYVAGGEPTIMHELYTFLEDCIEKKKTSFEIQLNTNAVSLTKQFKSLLKHFNNFNFEISIDGYGLVNQYIRWPTNWDKLVNNIDYICGQGHNISFNSVVSIYNIASLYSIIEFLSSRYEKIPIHLNPVMFTYLKQDILSPYAFPDAKLIIANLDKIKKLKIYHNDLVLKNKVDEYQDYFKNKHIIDLPALASFFEYNDKLDISRNIKLIDYIPELEQYRTLINRK
jgi:MoaA/NifB/PqqE/SkfB family radical SAM enzyme